MKTNLLITKRLMVLSFSIIILQLPGAFAQGTAFTYEGRLQNNDSPASGTYNLTFSLFNTYSSGVPIAGPVTNNAVSVTNGLFTVLVDFGPGVFTGQTNWLEIAVETNGGSTFTTLSPRQQLTPVPYAIYAESANGLNGTLSADQLTSIGNTNGGGGNFFVGSSGNSTTSGSDNTANGYQALFANTSGTWNTANGEAALRMNTSGSDNAANGNQALFANTSGSYNTANGGSALHLNMSGNYNTANGYSALYDNTSGSYNIALGFQAGYYITTGSSNIDIGNPGAGTDTNIIRIGTSQKATYLVGTVYANGVALTSDRNAKENFTAVNAREVLAKVASLPVTEWNYKTDTKDVQHIGPMAQDFQAAFQLGTDAKHISVVDEEGVALAAIQGLNQKLNEKDAEIQTLKQQNDSLAERLNKLQATVKQLAANK